MPASWRGLDFLPRPAHLSSQLPAPNPLPKRRCPARSLRARPRRGWATRKCARLWRAWWAQVRPRAFPPFGLGLLARRLGSLQGACCGRGACGVRAGEQTDSWVLQPHCQGTKHANPAPLFHCFPLLQRCRRRWKWSLPRSTQSWPRQCRRVLGGALGAWQRSGFGEAQRRDGVPPRAVGLRLRRCIAMRSCELVAPAPGPAQAPFLATGTARRPGRRPRRPRRRGSLCAASRCSSSPHCPVSGGLCAACWQHVCAGKWRGWLGGEGSMQGSLGGRRAPPQAAPPAAPCRHCPAQGRPMPPLAPRLPLPCPHAPLAAWRLRRRQAGGLRVHEPRRVRDLPGGGGLRGWVGGRADGWAAMGTVLACPVCVREWCVRACRRALCLPSAPAPASIPARCAPPLLRIHSPPALLLAPSHRRVHQAGAGPAVPGGPAPARQDPERREAGEPFFTLGLPPVSLFCVVACDSCVTES